MYMALENIDELYRQFNTCKSPKKKRDLYKAIKRAESKRRKEKLKGIIVI